MKVLRYIACSLAMFSRVPIPRSLNLAEDDMRYILAAFPLVGVLIGAVALVWWWLCGVCEFSAFLRAAGFVGVPFLVAGAIHMDGFVDVCDTPYVETIEKIREIGYQMYDVRWNKK